LLSVPVCILSNEQTNLLIDYSIKALDNPAEDIRLMSVQFMYRLVKQCDNENIPLDKIKLYINNFSESEILTINYLKYKIADNLQMPQNIIKIYSDLLKK